MPGPLAGIRVLDFSRVLAGPYCGETLLDLGADVIKLEPPTGDLSRQALPRKGGISGYYAQQNAGKRNVSIDLNKRGALEVALRLCDRADVIVESFRPGGEITVPGRPWHFSDDDGEPERRPARRGEHNEQVLTELGYDAAEIDSLQRRGVLVSDR